MVSKIKTSIDRWIEEFSVNISRVQKEALWLTVQQLNKAAIDDFLELKNRIREEQ